LRPLKSEAPPAAPPPLPSSKSARHARVNETPVAPPPEPDNPFTRSSGLPAPQPEGESESRDFEDDRKVTEVIRLEKLK
jgi:hypothetical protein